MSKRTKDSLHLRGESLVSGSIVYQSASHPLWREHVGEQGPGGQDLINFWRVHYSIVHVSMNAIGIVRLHLQIMELISPVRYTQSRTNPRGFFRFQRIDPRVVFRLDHISLVVRHLLSWCVVL